MTINPITPNAPLSNPSHANQHLTVNGSRWRTWSARSTT